MLARFIQWRHSFFSFVMWQICCKHFTTFPVICCHFPNFLNMFLANSTYGHISFSILKNNMLLFQHWHVLVLKIIEILQCFENSFKFFSDAYQTFLRCCDPEETGNSFAIPASQRTVGLNEVLFKNREREKERVIPCC